MSLSEIQLVREKCNGKEPVGMRASGPRVSLITSQPSSLLGVDSKRPASGPKFVEVVGVKQ